MGVIRLMLALAVVVAHVGGDYLQIPLFGGNGYAAVSCFFIISGFYMSLVLTLKYRRGLSEFYTARIIRLFPLYFLILGVTVALQAASMLAGKPLGAASLLMHERFAWWEYLCSAVANLTFVGSDWLVIYSKISGSPISQLTVLPVIWSLGVEVTFYLMAPFVLRGRTRVVLAALALAVAFRIGVAWTHDFRWSFWMYYFAPSNLAFFFAGALAHRVNAVWPLVPSTGGRYVIWASLVALLLFASHIFTVHSYTFLYVLLALAVAPVFELSKDWKWDRLVGELSYPVYLIHAAILTVYAPLRHFVPEQSKLYAITALTLILSASAVFIEARWQSSLRSLLVRGRRAGAGAR